MKQPTFETLRPPSKIISTSITVHAGYTARNFLTALEEVRKKRPGISDNDIEVGADLDGAIYLAVYSSEPNPNYNKELEKYDAKLEAQRKEYASWMEEYKKT